MDGGAVEAESRIEILRAQRAAMRGGKTSVQDSVRENEGIDEADPERVFDDGIRLEPFNMRREMAEGHFDEAGMYILNKQEEKEVTDAWLDTVDQAERTAIFKRNERQQKAAKTATSRISSLNKNLGKDEEDEDEDKDGEEQPVAVQEQKPKEEPAEEPDDPVAELGFLEELIGMLLPLEKPAEALARLARRQAGPKDEPLRMRARKRQARAEAEAAKGAAQAQAAPGVNKRGKRTLNEFGDYEAHVPSKKVEVVAAAAAAGVMGSESAAAPVPTRAAATVREEAAGSAGSSEMPAASLGPASQPAASSSAAEPPTAVPATASTAAPAASSAAEEDEAQGEQGTTASAPSLADAAAVAAAAQKAAAKDKAEKEAQEAFAAEQARVARQTVNMAVDASAGVEAAANVAAEQPRAERPTEAVPVEVEPDVRPADQPMKKRANELGDEERGRKRKIERLTEICDRLLERGVLVYDSTREALAIELRERKGEKILAEAQEVGLAAAGAEPPTGAAADSAKESPSGRPVAEARDSVAAAGSATAAAPTADGVANAAQAPSPEVASILFSNKRIKTSEGEATSGGLASLLAAADAAAAGEPGQAEPAPAKARGQQLLWQYRWTASPEQLHGPFDSLTMHGWTMQACFAPERPAEIRQCDEENQPMEQCWHRWDELDFSLYL